MQHTELVRTYYDNNTPSFIKLGEHGGTQNIHSALWAEGVTTLEEAISYSNQLVLEELESLKQAHPTEIMKVLDLGCGVGSGVLYLAEKFVEKAQFTGITLSPLQAKIAGERGERLQSESDVKFMTGDFLDLPKDLPQQHLAYAIEAFMHAADPEKFFAEAGRVIQAGGKLVLVDEFLSEVGTKPERLARKQRRWLEDFREGWLAASLISLSQLEDYAAKAGFRLQKEQNLTPYLVLGRPRDKFIAVLVALFGPIMRRSTYFKSLTGGHANQQCLISGLVSYRQVVLEKVRD